MENAPAKAQGRAPLPGGAFDDAAAGAGPTVMMAMSGGVDSSVAALLLSEAGYGVTGATMKLFGADVVAPDCDSSCCSADDVEDARAVCRRLGVPHYTFNFGELFGEAVIDRFCGAYLGGTTPNPCIDCNRFLKFDALQRRRRELGLGFVATGHYARRAWDARTGRWRLLRARDAAKDQSYVLYHLTQDALAHMLFPLGELTKPEVRELARAHGFATAEKPESQDICFVPDGDYAAFIGRRCGCGAAFEPGEIVNREGKVLGEHKGLIHYTVGQRKGIGVAAPEPLYVFAKDAAANQLVVGTAAEVQVREVTAHDVNLIAVERIEAPCAVTAKTHYRQRPMAATVEQTGDDELRVVFDEPQRAAAPGQAVVLYRGDVVVGGGTIC